MFSRLSLRQVCASFCLVFLVCDMVDVVITVLGTGQVTFADSDDNHTNANEEVSPNITRCTEAAIPVIASHYIIPHIRR